MPAELATDFANAIAEIESALFATPGILADVPWRAGGWTRKQIVGHLLDSATNNRQRFVRAALDGSYCGPQYEQQQWIDAHGYADQPWAKLLAWWKCEQEILVAVVSRIPAERLGALCVVGEDVPVTLEFLIRNYLSHQRGHLDQIRSAE
jgi:hypothetical protein